MSAHSPSKQVESLISDEAPTAVISSADGWSELTEQVRLPALSLLLVTAIFFILRLTGLAIEDLQTYIFPVFLLSFLFLFRRLKFAVSVPAVALILAVWAFNALHVRGYLAPGGAAAYFGRLENDPTGLVGRGVMLRVNHIAETYELSSALPVQRLFGSSDQASEWIATQADAPAVIVGNSGLLRVLVSPRLDQAITRMLSRFRSNSTETSAQSEALLRSYGIDPALDVIEVSVAGPRTPMFLVSSPETIAVPGQPVEMNRHYLAWLVNGLLRLTEEQTKPALRQLGLKKNDILPDLARFPAAVDAFNEASRIVGDWPTPIPIIAARFYLGTMHLIEALDGRIEPAAIGEADQLFKSAAGFARREGGDPVAAALWNNHAVTRLLLMRDEDDLREIKRWLLRAAAVTDSSGRPVRAAKAAIANLIQIERAGI